MFRGTKKNWKEMEKSVGPKDTLIRNDVKFKLKFFGAVTKREFYAEIKSFSFCLKTLWCSLITVFKWWKTKKKKKKCIQE